MVSEAKVTAIVRDNEFIESLNEGEAAVVLDVTPFYAESGGQSGDTGIINNDEASFTVSDTIKSQNGVIVHVGRMVSGSSGWATW